MFWSRTCIRDPLHPCDCHGCHLHEFTAELFSVAVEHRARDFAAFLKEHRRLHWIIDPVRRAVTVAPPVGTIPFARLPIPLRGDEVEDSYAIHFGTSTGTSYLSRVIVSASRMCATKESNIRDACSAFRSRLRSATVPPSVVTR